MASKKSRRNRRKAKRIEKELRKLRAAQSGGAAQAAAGAAVAGGDDAMNALRSALAQFNAPDEGVAGSLTDFFNKNKRLPETIDEVEGMMRGAGVGDDVIKKWPVGSALKRGGTKANIADIGKKINAGKGVSTAEEMAGFYSILKRELTNPGGLDLKSMKKLVGGSALVKNAKGMLGGALGKGLAIIGLPMAVDYAIDQYFNVRSLKNQAKNMQDFVPSADDIVQDKIADEYRQKRLMRQMQYFPDAGGRIMDMIAAGGSGGGGGLNKVESPDVGGAAPQDELAALLAQLPEG